MAATAKRTFSLPNEQAGFIDELVATGAYASGSEVVRAGLRALKERDAAVEQWLRRDVVPVVAAVHEDPSLALSADEVFDSLRALHAERTSKGASRA